MKKLGVQISLLLLLNVSAPVPASSLQGSCIEAGFTECCNPQDGPCYSMLTFCLCEPSCRMHHDCCEDIDEICPLPASDLKPASPELMLSVNITFHTATLMWMIPAEASDNDTYTVLYWAHDSSNITLVHNSSVDATIGHMQRAVISGLEPGTIYQWIIETYNSVSSSRSLPSNFTTVRPAKLDHFKVGLHNTSAVVVSWKSPPIPAGVQLRKYVVHYKQTTLDTVLSTEFVTTMAENYGIIGGLRSGVNYQFWVEAVIQEMDGTLQTGDVLTARNVTLFIPDAVMVQLRGGPFKPCHDWTQETEVEILEIFRHVIRQTCTDRDSDLQDTLIHRDFVLCEHSSISNKESRAIYRATLYSAPNYTVQIISTLLEEYIQDGEFSDNPVLSGFLLDKTCPMSLHMSSEPLCSNPECPDSVIQVQTGSLGSTSNCSCQMEGEDMVVTLPLLVAALVAELFLMLFVVMFVAALVIGIRRRRLDDDKVTSQDSTHADPNIYT